MDTLRALPSVDGLLRSPQLAALVARHGRSLVTDSIRGVLASIRAEGPTAAAAVTDESLLDRIGQDVRSRTTPSLRRVFNLTGTILHTNLGRAPLPPEAIEAVIDAARQPSNLEFDLETGKRGDRDRHVEAALCRLTGGAAATVVNNNAAAVLLVLNSLALRKEVPTSRGELIEIGGSFRLPDIMKRAGCVLREVGTTNRVHLRDYADVIGPKTGLVMKVHTSNYEIVGFTSSVPEQQLSSLCRERGVPLAVDLGSGMLVDLSDYGLPHEPTPSEALAHGADIVTFSGDKLLGGPQAGLIVGRSDLVAAIKGNPLRRALRVDKMTIAALSAVLALYGDRESLTRRLPVLALLMRPVADIRATAERLLPPMSNALTTAATVRVADCQSQIGSGAVPTRTIASVGLAVEPNARRGTGASLQRIAAAFRRLPIPVIGRIEHDTFVLDLRALDDEASFAAQLPEMKMSEQQTARPHNTRT
jgi:L-seryl-tRNA(Ser) seleniumtransferase